MSVTDSQLIAVKVEVEHYFTFSGIAIKDVPVDDVED